MYHYAYMAYAQKQLLLNSIKEHNNSAGTWDVKEVKAQILNELVGYILLNILLNITSKNKTDARSDLK